MFIRIEAENPSVEGEEMTEYTKGDAVKDIMFVGKEMYDKGVQAERKRVLKIFSKLRDWFLITYPFEIGTGKNIAVVRKIEDVIREILKEKEKGK